MKAKATHSTLLYSLSSLENKLQRKCISLFLIILNYNNRISEATISILYLLYLVTMHLLLLFP